MKATILSRLVISYSIIFFLVVAASIYTVYQLDQVKQATHSVLIFDNRILDLQKALTDSLLSQMRYEKKCILMKDYTLYDQFLISKASFEKDLQEALTIGGDSKIGKSLMRLEEASHHYHALVTEEIGRMQADNKLYDHHGYSREKELAINTAFDELKYLGEYGRQQTYQKIMDLDMAVSNSRSAALGMIVATIIFGLGISVLITRSITKPLAIIKKKIQEIAKGDFETTITLCSPPEVGELASAFNAMCGKLKEVDKMKSDFLSLMAHELRTPLTSIKEGTSLLLEGVGGDVSNKQQRLLRIIEEEGKRLIDLVNTLLDLSKMEAGMMSYNFSHSDLLLLIKRTVVEVEPLAQAKRIRLKNGITDALPLLRMDPEKIHQALRNLIGNAIKFTPEGGCVTIEAQTNNTAIHVRIKDTGPGIPHSDLERIFEKYQQVMRTDSGPARGTGLGLAIVKHIMQAHGGRVWAESTLDKGSVFTFTLPASSL